LAALEAARKLGMTTIAFTGTAPGANAMRAHSDIVLAAPTDDTPLIQQIHITAAHAICEVVERELFSPP
jgi:D-sedoheptulose 7-phosphate isomerase